MERMVHLNNKQNFSIEVQQFFQRHLIETQLTVNCNQAI